MKVGLSFGECLSAALLLCLVSGSCVADTVGDTIELRLSVNGEDFDDFGVPHVFPWMEMTPRIVETNGKRHLTTTTAFSYNCRVEGHLVKDANQLSPERCRLASYGYGFVETPPAELADSSNPRARQLWRQAYYGSVSQHVIEVAGKQRLVGIMHGEHKNFFSLGKKRYQNVINTGTNVDDCPGNKDEDCNEAYNGFVGMSWAPLDRGGDTDKPVALENDEGPIVWPVLGYRKDGKKSSMGVRHPQGLVAKGFIWVYYLDESDSELLGKAAEEEIGYVGGIKVARAPVSSGGVPGSFKVYSNGSWVPALPEGFRASRIKDYLDRPGGAATTILSAGLDYILSFAVAQTTEGDFIGVQESISWPLGGWKVLLRRSTDGVNWSDPVLEVDSAFSWGSGDLHYPVLMNAAGDSNELIDAKDFYVVGTNEQNKAFARRIQMGQ